MSDTFTLGEGCFYMAARQQRTVGTTARGIRTPIVREGDDLVSIVVQSILASAKSEGFTLNDRDVVGITESILARAQGNYASVGHVALDINRKVEGDVAVVFPLLSRNRFSQVLQAIARSERRVYLFLSYPADEVGNHLMDIDMLEESGVNPWKDLLSESEYREQFGENVFHPYTGIDYVTAYKELAVDDNIEIYLTNDAGAALDFTDELIVANVHERARVKTRLKESGAKKVLTLDELLTEPINGSGYNKTYGLLGANKATDDLIKLFPRDSQSFVNDVQKALKDETGKLIEVMVYGDGAFKDPMGRIWELADPVVSPGYTEGLEGTPSEVKLKYIADTELQGLSTEAAGEALRKRLKDRENGNLNEAEMLGTTPRRITDLLGSLCDLTSGSGEKGTPVVLVQGYFDNYASE